MSETVLIVDDEESVRRTFHEWLTRSGLDCRVLVAADAESALQHANDGPIDLAILDWNLGSGSDGLQLLEDLSLFHPDVVAILVTGFAHQATPLDALRMGVRDYLDKNQDLNRDSFLSAVQKQLDRIVPSKRQRAFNQRLAEFRGAVEKILPLVRTTSALTDPVPLPQAVASLLRFMCQATHAEAGALLIRQGESVRAFDSSGQPIEGPLLPFAQSIAATVVSIQEPCAMGREDLANLELQPFEKGRSALLAAPLLTGPGPQVVVELFNPAAGVFSDSDRHLVQAASEFGGELLRQALAERQTGQMLFAAVETALRATETLSIVARPDQPPPPEVMDRLRNELNTGLGEGVDSDVAIQFAEAVRVLALRHGPVAVRHCLAMARSLRDTLDAVTGMN